MFTSQYTIDPVSNAVECMSFSHLKGLASTDEAKMLAKTDKILLSVFLTLVLNRFSCVIPVTASNCEDDGVHIQCPEQTRCSVQCKYISIGRLCIPDRLTSVEHLLLDIRNCRKDADFANSIPPWLFPAGNRIRSLYINSVDANNDDSLGNVKYVLNDTFANLDRLEELTLEGFEFVERVDEKVFVPLRSIKKLSLIGFGAQYLTYGQLGTALKGLSNSSLTHITMDSIHPSGNQEKDLNLLELFPISGVNITHLVFVYNDFSSVKGNLSYVLPHLVYFECRIYFLTYAMSSFGLDSLIFLNHSEELVYRFISSVYSFDDRDNSNILLKLTNFLRSLTPVLLSYYYSMIDSNDCYFGKLMRVNPSLKRLTAVNIPFYLPDYRPDICFDEDNQLEYVDFFRCPIAIIPRQLKGLKKLKYFNLQETRLRGLDSGIFHDMPMLEVLLLGGNDMGASIADDIDGNFFKSQNGTLRSLDLSRCNIDVIPPSLFSSLRNLQFLNLSANKIRQLEISVDQNARLSVLNLSGNAFQTISNRVIGQFESLGNQAHTEQTLLLDLSRNPFTCFCNNTEFTTWLKTTEAVSLQNFDRYTCLHPNGSTVNVSDLNLAELSVDCEALQDLSNFKGVCPCNGLNVSRLRQISLHLSDTSCTYGGKSFSYSELISKSGNSSQDYWWCSKVPEVPPFEKNPRFIAPVAIGCAVLIALGTALIVIYKKRYSASQIASKIQCMDMRPYIMYVIRALAGRSQDDPRVIEYDAFVYCQAEDEYWTWQAVLSRLGHLKVVSSRDIVIGASMAEAILEAIKKSRVVILILSPAFKEDGWCREASLRSYTMRPAAIIPILKQDTERSIFEDDILFSNMIVTHNPIRLSVDDVTDDDSAWTEVTTRISAQNRCF